MKARKIADLPIPQSGCGNTRLVFDGMTLTLEFEYRKEGKDFIGLISFQGVVAHRFRDELHSGGFASEAYESIAEIEGSDWSARLNCRARHFAVFLSSNGYFEVLADEYALAKPSEGTLE